MAEGGAGQGSGSPRPAMLDADALMDEILAKKGPQKYTQGFSEDNWEEEMEHIPLFMTRSPDEIDPEKAPALAALQDIKYEEETPQGRALLYKDDGNEQFCKKDYRKAVAAYTAGIKEKPPDSSLNAILYCNRAAAEFYLGNYRSSLMDATQAKKLKPDHMKAIIRGALACMQLKRFGDAVEWCKEGMKVDQEDGKLREIHTKASREKKQQERDQRKEMARAKTKRREDQKLLDAIKLRGIHLAEDNDDVIANEKGFPPELSLQGPHPSGDRVHLDSDGNLVWPVFFVYPEHGQTDFIAAFHENHRFSDHIDVMFGQQAAAPWDHEGNYTPSSIEIYYEDCSSKRLIQVPLDTTLKDALSSKSYTVVSGTPSFIILAAATPFREHFLSRNS